MGFNSGFKGLRLLPFIQNYCYLIRGSVLTLSNDSLVASLSGCFCMSWPRDIRFRGSHINFILLPYGSFKTKCPVSQGDKAYRLHKEENLDFYSLAKHGKLRSWSYRLNGGY